jgi:hypothetical protein
LDLDGVKTKTGSGGGLINEGAMLIFLGLFHSQGKPGEPLKLKDEKELKPVSLRVRDAAEALLAVIFEQVSFIEMDVSSRWM